MHFRTRLFSAIIWIPVALASGACAFKKDTDPAPTAGNHPAFIETQKTKQFCDGVSTDSSFDTSNILLLSTSNKIHDLCYVWKYIKDLKTKKTIPLDLEIIANFSKALLQILSAQEQPPNTYGLVAKRLSSLSAKLEGASFEDLIKINNLTNNAPNNIELVPFALSGNKIAALFSESDNLSTDEFNAYWEAVSEKITRQKMCTNGQLLKIIELKRLSPHLSTLTSSCGIILPADEILGARIKLLKRLSDSEVAFFENGILTKNIFYDSKIETANTHLITKAITWADHNLFVLTKYTNASASTYISYFLLCLESKIDLEPFMKRITQKEFEKILTWDGLKDAVTSPNFLTLISILDKYSITPIPTNTKIILEGLKADRALNGNKYVSDLALLSIWEYLRASSNSGFFRASRELALDEQEIELLLKGKITSTRVLNILIRTSFASVLFDANLNDDGTLRLRNNMEATLENKLTGFKIGGEIFESIIIKKTTSDISSEYLLYYMSGPDKEQLAISFKNFNDSLKDNQEPYPFEINCRSRKIANSCDDLKEKHSINMQLIANAIRKAYLSKTDMPSK